MNDVTLAEPTQAPTQATSPPRTITPVSVADAITQLQQFPQTFDVAVMNRHGEIIAPYFEYDGQYVLIMPQSYDDSDKPEYPPNEMKVRDVLAIMEGIDPTNLVYSKNQGKLWPPAFALDETVVAVRHKKMPPPNTTTAQDVVHRFHQFPADALVYFVDKGTFYAPNFTYKGDYMVISIYGKEEQS